MDTASTPNQIPQTTRVATFKVSLTDYEGLETVARREERSVSAVIRLAIRDYLEANGLKEAA